VTDHPDQCEVFPGHALTRVVVFPLVPSNRTKLARVTLIVHPELKENEACGDTRRVNRQDNASVGTIVYWPKTWGRNDRLLQVLHGSFLFWAPGKIYFLLGQDHQGPCMLGEILDPDSYDATYS